jgi:hypothetical protein
MSQPSEFDGGFFEYECVLMWMLSYDTFVLLYTKLNCAASQPREVVCNISEAYPEGRVDHVDVLDDDVRGVADGEGDRALERGRRASGSASVLIFTVRKITALREEVNSPHWPQTGPTRPGHCRRWCHRHRA